MECLMDHIVLNVDEMERMLAFYTGVLELETERLEAYRAGRVPFPSVRLNADTVIDLFPKRGGEACAETAPGCEDLNHFCIALKKEEWEALRERLHAARIPIEEGPVPRWGARGTGTSVYFRDPERNLIEARYYEGSADTGACLLGS